MIRKEKSKGGLETWMGDRDQSLICKSGDHEISISLNLYRVIVDEKEETFVVMTERDLTSWLNGLIDTGDRDRLRVDQVHISDADEINHVFFC